MRFVNTCIAARVVEPIIESCGETSSGIVVCGGKLSAIWSQTETQTAFLRCEATSCFSSSIGNATSFLSGFRYRFSPMRRRQVLVASWEDAGVPRRALAIGSI